MDTYATRFYLFSRHYVHPVIVTKPVIRILKSSHGNGRGSRVSLELYIWPRSTCRVDNFIECAQACNLTISKRMQDRRSSVRFPLITRNAINRSGRSPTELRKIPIGKLRNIVCGTFHISYVSRWNIRRNTDEERRELHPVHLILNGIRLLHILFSWAYYEY